MSELLLELFSEEIPAMMQKNAAIAYKDIFSKYFEKQSITYDAVTCYVGPRRLAIHATALKKSNDTNLQEELRGPRVSAPEAAVQGFCQANNITKKELTIKSVKDVEYFFAYKLKADISLAAMLSADLANLISAYTWPKSMYWGDYKIKWVRPLKNILCLLDGKVLEFSYGHLTSNNQSFGHRFMAPIMFEVKGFADYLAHLEKYHIVPDSATRQELIMNKAQFIAGQMHLTIREDPQLLEEVSGLVELPNVLMGRIDKEFLNVPSEILISSMRANQKYFSLFTPSGEFAPYFIFVANIDPDDPSDIIKGNEKVLSARLADAKYFYEQDLPKIMAKETNERLGSIMFHAKLGSLAHKVARLVNLVSHVDPADEELRISAFLCKNDIASEVVNEFPELQGVMGYYYAKSSGYSEIIAAAIRDHYKDGNFSNKTAAILALADKVDTLCGLMLAGEKATGSKDPYALRRQALGIIRCIAYLEDEQGMKISLPDLITHAILQYVTQGHEALLEQQQISELVMDFLEERLRFALKEHYEQNLVNAVLDLRRNKFIHIIKHRLEALNDFLQHQDNKALMASYKRVSNILISVQDGADFEHGARNEVDESLLQTAQEKALYSFLQFNFKHYQESIDAQDYQASLAILARFYRPLEEFFAHVMVNVADEALKRNRLSLMAQAKALFTSFADFDKI
jgi:glycyl-tRNA synthetase beta chain